jgi:hypothetical protein
VAMFSCVLRSNGRREGSHFHEHFLCGHVLLRGVVYVLATVPTFYS